jgi:N-acetylglucosaminyl-diphospho-decaprenol L-rhamnosyltransferase
MHTGSQAGTARATALVVTWNASKLLGDLLPTLEGLAGTVSVIVVDNCSSDGTPEALESHGWIRLIRSPRNGGFGYGNNIGLRHVRTPYVLLLNSDASVRARDVMAMADFLDRNPSCAGVQPLLRVWDWPEVTAGRGMGFNSMMEGFDLGFLRFEPHPLSIAPVEVGGVGAAAALLRSSALRDCSGFDERLFMYFEDVDLMIRLRAAGWRFALLPGLEGKHRVGFSSRRSRARSWEITSSLMLERKYGTGYLMRRAAREARIWGLGISRLRPPVWRLAGLARGMLAHVEPLRGCPVPPVSPPPEEPSQRPPESFPLDREGALRTGPGWLAGSIQRSFAGFGALSVATSGVLRVVLRAREGSHTCRIWQEKEPLVPFMLTPEASRVEAQVGPGRVYIAADDRDSMPVIEALEARLGS